MVRRNGVLKEIKFKRLARKAGTTLFAKNLVYSLRLSHQMAKEKRQSMLNGYITYCAMKIQRNYRGYYARRYVTPFRRALGKSRMKKLHAVMSGWKTRQILKMKDVRNKAILVKDHDKDNVK